MWLDSSNSSFHSRICPLLPILVGTIFGRISRQTVKALRQEKRLRYWNTLSCRSRHTVSARCVGLTLQRIASLQIIPEKVADDRQRIFLYTIRCSFSPWSRNIFSGEVAGRPRSVRGLFQDVITEPYIFFQNQENLRR